MTASIAALKKICEDYHKRIDALERRKIDIEFEVERRDLEVRTSHKQMALNKKYENIINLKLI